MSDVLARIVSYKREEIAAAKRATLPHALAQAARAASPPRGFASAVRGRAAKGDTALIAEIKKASPSRGLIRPDFDPAAAARAYEAAGAACISVLTDAPSFQGSREALEIARAACGLPALRKDFMLDPYQVDEARAWGADCILIVLACVTIDEARSLHARAIALGMDVLIEMHDEHELPAAVELAGAAPERSLIGINNRDLRDFSVDLATTERLAARLPGWATVVSESGIFTSDDVARLRRSGVSAVLVGEGLMREPDIEAAARALLRREERAA